MSIFSVTNTNNSGSGSLRQAIVDANALSGKDMINFDGVFADNIADTIILAGSSLAIADDLIINGTGADLLTVSGNNASRIFEISAGATVEIQGLTIANGYVPGDNNGGGILNLGNLTLLHSTVRDNRIGGSGGGISSSGILSVNDSIISSNQSKYGGGISSSGHLSVNDSIISSNQSKEGGGILDSSGPTLSIISNSSVINNISSGYGGGISSFFATVINCTITGNSAQESGGGINGGIVINSTISHNSAKEGGGIYDFSAISSSIISDNSGGGIFSPRRGNFGVVVGIISNSTISGNSEYGISNFSGRFPSIAVYNSTIIGNLGYGVYSYDYSSGITLKNSIVAGNTNQDITDNVSSNGYNLIGNLNHNTNFSIQEQLSVPLTDVLDTTLRDNGGSVKTYALVVGSIAINAGNNADPPIKKIYAPETDEYIRYIDEEIPFDSRGEGFTRISGGRIDIGAYEAQVNVINGTRQTNTIEGTAANDIITGYQRGDTLIGGAGGDAFVYTSIQDAGDIITDFTVGTDKIVLNKQLFKNASLGNFNFDSAIAGGYLRFETQSNDTIVFIDPDGSSGVGRAIKLITARNVSASQLNNSANFAFYGVTVASTFTFTVTNTNDSGAGSLRQAIQDANLSPGKDIIKFDGVFADNVADTITLSGGSLIITDDLDIEGIGANLLTVSGNKRGRIFEIPKDVTVEIEGLTIVDGSLSNTMLYGDLDGNAIKNSGTLILLNSTITNNGGGLLGAIYNAGTMIVSNSTISGNSSGYAGGIYNSGILTVNNSTISGNSAENGGGIGNSGTLTVNNSTITLNTSIYEGAGIYNDSSNSATATATIKNSIVAGNISYDYGNSGSVSDVKGNFISNGHNLIGNLDYNSTGFNNSEESSVPITEIIDPTLQYNGGTVKTHALLPESRAINGGSNEDVPADITDLDGDGNLTEPVLYDQRGTGFARISLGQVDIGAYELI